MKELDEIRARLAAATPGPWLVNDEEQTVRVEHPEGGIWCGEIMFDRSGYGRTVWTRDDKPDAEFIANAPTDLARLLAAVEAVEALAEQWGSTGHIVALAFENELRAAITAALTPIPAVPGGAVGAGGAVDEHEGAETVLGAQAGAEGLRGGDLVEYIGMPGVWKVIPSNVYDDKHVTIQCANRLYVSVPVIDLQRIEAKA